MCNNERVETVTISADRYEDLLVAATKLQIIKDVATKDKGTYGYSSETSKTIDTILNIERKVEE